MKNDLLIKLIPTEVRITPKIKYEIVWIKEFVNDSKQMGECRRDELTRQIVISESQPKGEVFKTFLHEVLHAIDLENDINLTESQVRKLENGIFRVLRLNNTLDKLIKMG